MADKARVDDVLARALELPAGERGAFLDRACGDDAELRRQVEELLGVDSDLVAQLERPAFEHFGRISERDHLGKRIGPYVLEEVLGSGGTATVYRGRRVEGVGPEQVAVKLLRGGFDGEQFRHRFTQEGEILARLRHPHIASVLSGGCTEGGLPYLLLEYVEGLPIGTWCEQNELGIEERLALFCEVCSAVDHAHRNLIVHRDLKPGNILVDQAGRVKLLDFGISKLLDPLTQSGETRTATAFRMLTPEYASPEQLTFRPTTVAADVYSLGVVLFELLAGRRPFVKSGDTEELYRTILEHPPPRPSQVARFPGSWSWAPWRRSLEGDLDAITLKTLEKEPELRYPSAAHLADDLRRHLGNRPVEARAGTLGYRLGRLARRRWRELGMVAMLLVFLVTQELDRRAIRVERDRAVLMRDFLVELLGQSNPFESQGEEVTLRQVLDRSVEQLHWFDDDPHLQASFLTVAGEVYTLLGDWEGAERLLLRGLALRRDRLGAPPAEMADSLASLGLLRRQEGDARNAEEILREALALHEEGRRGPDRLRYNVLQNLGLTLADLARFDAAETTLREGLALARQLDPDSPQVALALNNLGFCLYQAGRPQAAMERFRESLDLRRTVRGDRHPEYAVSLNNFAAAAMASGELETAESSLEQALRIWQETLGEHPMVALAMGNLGAFYLRRGDLDSALEKLEAGIALGREVFPPDHPDLAVALNNLGNLLTRRGESERAVEVLDDAYSIFVRAVGEDHPHTVGTLWNRERSRGDLGDLEEAAGRIAAEIDRLQTAGTESALALVEEGFPELIEAHFHAGALEPAEEAWRRWGAWTDARGIDPAPGRLGLWRARLLLARDEPATALQEARRALEELDTDAELVPWARCVEGGALERLGRASEARDRLESCRALPAPYVLQLREAEAYLRGEHYPGRPP